MKVLNRILSPSQRQLSKSAARPAQKNRPTENARGRKRPECYWDEKVPTVECLAVDWLELSFMTNPDFKWLLPSYDFGPFTFVQTIQNKVWSRVYDVFYNGERFGLLKTSPNSTKAIRMNEIHLKLENSWLYSNYKTPLCEFESAVDCTFDHISRIDIAGDGKNILHPMNLWLCGKIKRMTVGRSQHAFCEAQVDEYCQIHSRYFRLGSTLSEKFMRIYDKAKELKVSGKHYIKNFWLKNGVQDADNMERIEMTLRAKFSRHIFESEGNCTTLHQVIDRLENQNFLSSVLTSYCEGMYEFRLLDSTEVKRCTPAYKLAFAGGNFILCKIGKPVRTVSDGLYIVKMTLKAAWQLFLKTGNLKYSEIAREMAHNSYLTGYYEERKPAWQREYARMSTRCPIRPKAILPFLDFFRVILDGKQLQAESIVPDGTDRTIEHVRAHKQHLEMLELNLVHERNKNQIDLSTLNIGLA